MKKILGILIIIVGIIFCGVFTVHCLAAGTPTTTAPAEEVIPALQKPINFEFPWEAEANHFSGTGSVTKGSTSVKVDGSPKWSKNQWAGFEITIGGQSRIVKSNTESALTVKEKFTIPDQVSQRLTITATPGRLVSFFYRYALALVGVAAVAMIVYGGIRYAISGGGAGKKDALDIIKSAIFGLVLLLGSYVLLNTINPDIVNLSVADEQITGLVEQRVEPIIISGGEEGMYDDLTTTKTGKCPDFSKASPSFDVVQSTFQKDIETYAKKNGGKLSNVYLLLRKNPKCRTFMIINKSTGDRVAGTLSFNIGRGDDVNGDGKIGTGEGIKVGGVRGDKVTPVANLTLVEKSVNLPGGIISQEFKTCMGPTFILLSAKDKYGASRGIGIHGDGKSINGNVGMTAGCIKLKNRDVYTLGKYFVSGTEIRIRNDCPK